MTAPAPAPAPAPADKPTLRELLDAVRPDSDDLRDSRFQDVERAIDDSDEWRDVFERQQAFDRRVAAAVQDVEIPDGLAMRLFESLAAARDSEPAVVQPSVPPLMLTRRRWLRSVMSAAAVALAVGLGWLVWPGGATLMTLQEARHALPTEQGRIEISGLEAFKGGFVAKLPEAAWRRHVAAEVKGIDWTGDEQHDAAVYEFQVAGRVHGYLLIFRSASIADPPERRRLSDSGVDYRPVANSAWTDAENGLVYVCYVDQGDISTLQRLLYPQAA